jgi:hypothetical protein
VRDILRTVSKQRAIHFQVLSARKTTCTSTQAKFYATLHRYVLVEPPHEVGERRERTANVFWQIKEARAIVLEAERGILPALIPQLQSSSVVRRRGAAGVMR